MYGTTHIQNRASRFNVGQSPKRESNIGGINFMSHLNDATNQSNTSMVDDNQSQKGSEKSFNNDLNRNNQSITDLSRNNQSITDNQYRYQ